MSVERLWRSFREVDLEQVKEKRQLAPGMWQIRDGSGINIVVHEGERTVRLFSEPFGRLVPLDTEGKKWMSEARLFTTDLDVSSVPDADHESIGIIHAELGRIIPYTDSSTYDPELHAPPKTAYRIGPDSYLLDRRRLMLLHGRNVKFYKLPFVLKSHKHISIRRDAGCVLLRDVQEFAPKVVLFDYVDQETLLDLSLLDRP